MNYEQRLIFQIRLYELRNPVRNSVEKPTEFLERDPKTPVQDPWEPKPFKKGGIHDNRTPIH